VTDPFRLDGKRALVTGANTGIGQAIALGLARAGAEVIAAGRSPVTATLDPDPDDAVARPGSRRILKRFEDIAVIGRIRGGEGRGE